MSHFEKKYDDRNSIILLRIWIIIVLLIFVGCRNETFEDSLDDSNSLDKSNKPPLVQSSTDGWRQFAFDAKSIDMWIDEDKNSITDVTITIFYHDNPGVAVREVQQWHIDYANRRYRVSDSFSFDEEGNYCET